MVITKKLWNYGEFASNETEPSGPVSVFTVHEENRIESTYFADKANRNKPSGGIYKINPESILL